MLQGVRKKLKGSRLEKQVPSNEDEIKTFQMGFLTDTLFEFSDILLRKKWSLLKIKQRKVYLHQIIHLFYTTHLSSVRLLVI
jgi:hypothetical protein